MMKMSLNGEISKCCVERKQLYHLSQFSSVQLLSRVRLFVIPRTGLPVLHQLPELTQTPVHELVMPSNHLILCGPLLLLFQGSSFQNCGEDLNEASVVTIQFTNFQSCKLYSLDRLEEGKLQVDLQICGGGIHCSVA